MKIIKDGSEYFLDINIEGVTLRPKLEIRGPVAISVLEEISKTYSDTVENVSSDLDRLDSSVVQSILEDLDDLMAWVKMAGVSNPTAVSEKISIIQSRYHKDSMVGS